MSVERAYDLRSYDSLIERLVSPELALDWLLTLRWLAVLGQLTTISVSVFVFAFTIPFAHLMVVVAVMAFSNTALILWRRLSPGVSTPLLAAILLFDIVLLSMMLGLSGGADNPFSSLYLVQVVVGALLLPARFALLVAAAAGAGFAALTPWSAPLVSTRTLIDPLTARSAAMSVSLGITALVNVFFVVRLRQTVSDQHDRLLQAQRNGARTEKLATLGTFAANAAHELSTPLSTIAIAANEIETSQEASEDINEDARLIRDEVERCYDIIRKMSGKAGQMIGEAAEQTTIGAVLDRLINEIGARDRCRVKLLTPKDDDVTFQCPVHGLVQVLSNLVQNGLQASDDDGEVVVQGTWDVTLVRFSVVDHGEGIPSAVANRVGEPFFTTKAAGEGMGLGVFLGRSFAERCGGKLHIQSQPGAGTKVTVELPIVLQPTSRKEVLA